MNNNLYVNKSLQLHLFFLRIMKEHSFFLAAAFVQKEEKYIYIATSFHENFSRLLKQVIELSNGYLSADFLSSKEIVTENTLEAENMTSEFLDFPFDEEITQKELQLKEGNKEIDARIVNSLAFINRQVISLVKQLIDFKDEILKRVLNCKIYTMNYPLLIEHIRNEAVHYLQLLTNIEEGKTREEVSLYEEEMFWNTIMKEHAEFIRGLLDPKEKDLINISETFVKQYNKLLVMPEPSLSELTKLSEENTKEFRDFKLAGEKGILSCKIRSIIIPLLADHVLREVNHFLRILQENK